MLAAAEAIDLTGSSPTPPVRLYNGDRTHGVGRTTEQLKKPAIGKDAGVSLEDGELPPTTKSPNSKPRKPRKRKVSQADPVFTKGENGECGDKRRRRGGERDEPPRANSHSPPDRAARRRALREKPSDSLFFVDDKPGDIRDPYISTALAGPSRTQQTDGLVLPIHVKVAKGSSEAQEPSLDVFSDAEEGEDFIDYLDIDGDRSIGISRYFHDTREIDTKTRFACKNCGEEGDHKARDCPHQICLTCGARDEHSTRSCPISKTCYTCGMKGHINKTCPNRYASRDNPSHALDDCGRCGSRSHYGKECPTLWRIYDYLSDNGRDSTLNDRETKKDLPLGVGGEGYIGPEDWCFNCGDAGHLGDDCIEAPHQHDIPREPSAFSEYNIRSGPFFDPHARPSKKSGKKPQREWEDEGRWGDGHGSSLPVNVGKQGRKKEQQRMQSLDARARAEEDEDDFFSRNVKNRAAPTNERNDHKVKHTGIVIKGAAERFSRDPPRDKPPSLSERLGPPREGSYSNHPRDREHGPKDRNRDRDRNRGMDWERDRDRSRGGQRSRDGGHDRGPRYRGGYARP